MAGVVPAAGRSVRMGSSKALLDAHGRTFLERVLTALREGGCTPLLVVVRNLEGPEADLARSIGVEPISNPNPRAGPISSVRAAIRHLERVSGPGVSGLALHPVDHPLVDPETVRLLLDAFRARAPSVAIPTHRGESGHPVILSARLFPELLADPLPGGARTVVRRYRQESLRLEVTDEGVLVDIDTAEEYRAHFPSQRAWEGDPR